MNHIYRLVWSEIANTWVAVAEIAKGRGKRSSTVGARPKPDEATVGWAPPTMPVLRFYGLCQAFCNPFRIKD